MEWLSSSFSNLEKALDAAALGQRTNSANIANVNTPHYKTKEVRFKSELAKATEGQPLDAHRTRQEHIPFRTDQESSAPSQLASRPGLAMNHNGNNVDVDYEMTQMAKNQLWYNALIERANGKMRSLGTVINEGR